MPGQFHPRGVTMRDCLKNRGGFDRVLMAVAATFLTVSATSALAQDPSRATPAELAIDAAVPRPEPANVPPPTINDFKMDSTASVSSTAKPEAAKTPEKTETRPADIVTAPISTPSVDTAKTDTAAAPASTPAAATPAAEPPKEVAKEPAPEPVKAA